MKYLFSPIKWAKIQAYLTAYFIGEAVKKQTFTQITGRHANWLINIEGNQSILRQL